MAGFIELTAADGHTFRAYVASPAGQPRGAVIVAPEIFGINSHIRSVADGYAADGYRVVAPAFYDRVQRKYETGYEPADIEAGRKIAMSLKMDDTLADLKAAADHVRPAGKVGLTGYCWGGTIAWVAAARVDGLVCSVPYYGGNMPQFIGEKPRCPVICHFAEKDQHPTAEQARAIAAAHPEITAHFYDAGHGFNCDHRGSYDAACAALARQRTLALLRASVG